MKRVVTALILAPLFILLIWYGSFRIFAAFIVAVSAICFYEYAKMAANKGIEVFSLQGLILVLILPLAFIGSLEPVFAVTSLAVISLFATALTDPEKGFERLSYTMLGVFYIGICLAAPILIRGMPDGHKLILLACCGVWGADIGAYYVGRAIGKNKLAPKISPGKTVEGAVGGVLLSIGSCFLFTHFFFPEAEVAIVLASGLIGGIVGPAGDLSESMLKRYFEVKDSGTILPGHGGLLDRIDALLFALPLFYIFLEFKGLVL